MPGAPAQLGKPTLRPNSTSATLSISAVSSSRKREPQGHVWQLFARRSDTDARRRLALHTDAVRSHQRYLEQIEAASSTLSKAIDAQRCDLQSQVARILRDDCGKTQPLRLNLGKSLGNCQNLQKDLVFPTEFIR